MTDTSPVLAGRESWDARLDRVQRSHPSTRDGSWAAALRDPDLMGRVLRDMLRQEAGDQDRADSGGGRRRGPLPMLDRADAEATLSGLVGGDYSTLPFADAFAALAAARHRSLTQLARETGLGRTTVHRLLGGLRPPSGAEMEAVAAAFGKPASYFAEWRAGLIAASVFDHFLQAPDASAAVARRLTRR